MRNLVNCGRLDTVRPTDNVFNKIEPPQNEAVGKPDLFLMMASTDHESIGCRVETDSMGAINVPNDRYYGAQTGICRQDGKDIPNIMPCVCFMLVL